MHRRKNGCSSGKLDDMLGFIQLIISWLTFDRVVLLCQEQVYVHYEDHPIDATKSPIKRVPLSSPSYG